MKAAEINVVPRENVTNKIKPILPLISILMIIFCAFIRPSLLILLSSVLYINPVSHCEATIDRHFEVPVMIFIGFNMFCICISLLKVIPSKKKL